MKSRSHQQGLLLIAVVFFFDGFTSVSAEIMHLNKVASYAETARVREEVQDACKPDVLLPAIMREEILNRTSISNVVLTDELPGKNVALAMELSILEVKTPPATSWTTEMRILKVKSVLYRDGNIVAEYVRNAKARGGGGLFTKLFKNRNSCQIVERLVREVSEQTVERFKLINLLPNAALNLK